MHDRIINFSFVRHLNKYLARGRYMVYGGVVACLLSCIDAPAKEPAATVDETRSVSMLFGGDVMQHIPQVMAAQDGSGYNYTPCFEHLRPIFDSADIVVMNLETTISANGRYSGYPLFASPVELVKTLKEMGTDVVMLANNHICDRGQRGILATIAAVDSAGLHRTGVFADSADYARHNPLYINSKGVNIAMLNYTYGTNGMNIPQGIIVNLIDTLRMEADIKRINRDTVEHVIVFLHWGEEYARKPNKVQRELTEWCYSRGVAFVVGSHPHVVQPIEMERDSTGRIEKLTAYSLGNLVSNQRWRYADGGILLKATVTHTPSQPVVIEVEHIPVWVHTPVIDGRKRYIVLPSAVADTMLVEGSAAKNAYNIFITDTEKLLDSTEPDTSIKNAP